MLWFALRMMRSPSEQTRLKGATQLGQSRNQRAISALTLALKDRSFRVRAAVVEALETSGWQPENEWQQALCMTVKGRVEEAAQLGAAAVEPLAVMLKGATLWEQRAKAADSLGRIKSPGAVEALSRALEDGDGSVRLRAARGLGLAGSDQAWDSLVSALADSDNRVREEAIQALATIGAGGNRAAEHIVPLLLDPHGLVRNAARDQLRAMQWQPSNESERAMYVVACGRWHEIRELGPEAIVPLEVLVKDPIETHYAWEEGLTQLTLRHALGSLLAAVNPRGSRVFEGLKKIDPDWAASPEAKARVPDCLSALRAEDPNVRWAAAWVLGEIRDDRAVMPLLERLAAKRSSDFAAFAARALGQIGDPRAVAPLVGLLMAHSPNQWDNTDHERMRSVASEALARIEGPGIEALERLQRHRNELVRTAATRALEERNHSR